VVAPQDRGTGQAQGCHGDGCAPGIGPKCATGTDVNVRAVGGAGQPCLWWSQGCSIGCDYCMTDPKHPDNKGKIPTKAINGNPPHADKAGFRKSYCDAPKTKAVLPKEYWTLNVHAIEGAVNDSYVSCSFFLFSRLPCGEATNRKSINAEIQPLACTRLGPSRGPVVCPPTIVKPHPPPASPENEWCHSGQAGGKFLQTPMGGDSTFKTVTVPGDKTYQMGDMGSKVLPEHPDAVTTWKIGTTPRVAWGMRYNHGGGYQYRLCPADKMPCTEADFQEMPLDFVRGSQAIMWNNGSLYNISHAAKYVDDSVCAVVPKGSTVSAAGSSSWMPAVRWLTRLVLLLAVGAQPRAEDPHGQRGHGLRRHLRAAGVHGDDPGLPAVPHALPGARGRHAC
jgi:hypothetical protein